MLGAAGAMAIQTGADAILVLTEGSTDWEKIRQAVPKSVEQVIVATDLEEDLDGAEAAGLSPLPLNKEKSPMLERLQHALLEAVADVLRAFQHAIDHLRDLRQETDRLPVRCRCVCHKASPGWLTISLETPAPHLPARG